jgi:hypothetical protein
MDQIKHPSRLVDQTYQPPPVRFRAVIEMSFPDADPWDPTDYGSLIEQWRKSLEESPTFKIAKMSSFGRSERPRDRCPHG